MARHLVVLLMNVTVEDGYILVRHQRIDNCRAVPGGPVPIGIEIKQWPVRQHDDARIRLLLFQVGFKPVELRLTNNGARIRDIIEDYEVHALVIECVIEFTEELLIRVTTIKRSVVLAGHEMNRRNL